MATAVFLVSRDEIITALLDIDIKPGYDPNFYDFRDRSCVCSQELEDWKAFSKRMRLVSKEEWLVEHAMPLCIRFLYE